MIIIWLILVLVSVSTIVLLQAKIRHRERKILAVLQDFAKEMNSTIADYDHWNSSMIGIDNMVMKRLFYIRKTNNEETRAVIHLSEVLRCRLVVDKSSILYNKEQVTLIEKIALVFSYMDNQNKDVVLEFYNADYDSLTLSGELQLAQKWSDIVTGILAANKHRKKEVDKASLTISSSFGEQASHDREPVHPTKKRGKYSDSRNRAA